MSFGARLALAFVGLVAITALVIAAVGFASAEAGVSGQLDRFLEDRAEELVDQSRDRPQLGDGTIGRDGHDRDGRKRGGVDDDVIAQTLDPDGSPTATTSIDLPIDDRDRALALGEGPGDRRYRTVTIDGDPYRMITVSLPEGGAVQVAGQLAQSNLAIGQIQQQLALAIPIVAVAAGLLGLVLARRITGPLRSLSTTVDTVAATGDLTVPVTVSGRDEVGRLAAGFDNLLQNLARSRHQQHQLVQDAAHELRTPLTSARANVDLLAAAPDLDPAERLDTLRSVQGQLRELTELVNEIVEVATDQQQARPFTTVALAAVVDEAVERFADRRPDRPVTTDLASVAVMGDHDSLVRAVDNLLSNADKYSPPGLPIAVTVTTDGRVAVADRGPGIDPSERDRVFDRFYRSDEARALPGSGLGLSIVASVVDAHGGTVAIDDHPGGGAVVSFTLPV